MDKNLLAILQMAKDGRPAVREMVDALPYTSNSVVIKMLKRLEAEGFIERPKRKARSIEVLPKGLDALAHPDEYNIDGPTFSGPRSLYLPWEDALIRRHAQRGHRIEQATAALNTHPNASARATKRDKRSVRYRAGRLGVTFKNENTRSIDNVSDS